jgi:ketosteroid isomerase-like protein
METKTLKKANQRGSKTQKRNPIEETKLRKLIESWGEALKDKDVEGIMSYYSSDISVFGLTPPLHYTGLEAHRKHWKKLFAMFEGPVDHDIRDLSIIAGEEIAFSQCLDRISGTMSNGEKGGVWTRASVCYRKIDDEWKITHEHVSVPSNLATGEASLDLKP